MALVRQERERLDPEARESFDRMVRRVRTMARATQEG